MPLSDLHQQKIAIHCTIAGREAKLVGHALYEPDADLGPVLRIRIADSDEMEFRLAETRWNGEVVVSHGPHWDYLIRLTQ